MGAFISNFPNKWKRRRAENFEASCQLALPNVQIVTLLFTFIVQKYIYPSVIIWMIFFGDFEVQVNGQLPKRGVGGGGGGKPDLPREKKTDNQSENRYHILEVKIYRGDGTFTL